MQSKTLEWEEAKDVRKDIAEILKVLKFPHIKSSRIFVLGLMGQNPDPMREFGQCQKYFRELYL